LFEIIKAAIKVKAIHWTGLKGENYSKALGASHLTANYEYLIELDCLWQGKKKLFLSSGG
jgi:hypothetical protein